MISISAFADEIAPDLEDQVTVLRQEGIGYVELRSMWRINVLDLDDRQLTQIRQAFGTSGIRVSAIGSPIGKVAIDTPFEPHLARFERALQVAHRFETPFIRIFSFYPPSQGGNDASSFRDTVLERLHELTARARASDITLLHENEKEIYGDTIDRCVDLLTSIDDPHFAAILDPANFIQCGQTPYPDGYEALKRWLRYVHVKDALADGTIVPVGEGVGQWPALLTRLRDTGYEGFLSLEPHLEAAGRFGGFSGPERFHQAAQALQGLLRSLDWAFS
jgi:sugar phosphate isomerase/epimerase